MKLNHTDLSVQTQQSASCAKQLDYEFIHSNSSFGLTEELHVTCLNYIFDIHTTFSLILYVF